MDIISLGSSILGGALGGVFRLAPEVIKYFDRKGERAHELSMQDKQLEFAKLQGSLKIQEAQIQADAIDISALKDVLVAQAQLTGNKFIDFINSFVRPYLAYSLSFLYFGVKITYGIALFQGGTSSYDIARALYTPDDQALFWGIVNFYFLDRVIRAKSR
jgi:hypothetical protein